MKENENIFVKGLKIILVPYEEHHVPKYHGWMESEELRELTASERLSLEEEYEMQRKWREDPDKCTFIVLDRVAYEQSQHQKSSDREIAAMVGDVNIFYNSDEGSRLEGEVEIMIAEISARGKGFGKEALCSMMRYAKESLGTDTFSSKIGFSNSASQGLFKSLGFKEVSRSDVFEEITFLLESSAASGYMEHTESYKLETMPCSPSK